MSILRGVVCPIKAKVCVKWGYTCGFYFQDKNVFLPKDEAKKYLNIDSEVIISAFYREKSKNITGIKGYYRDKKRHNWTGFKIDYNDNASKDMKTLANCASIMYWAGFEKYEDNEVTPLNIKKKVIESANKGAYNSRINMYYRRIEGSLCYIGFNDYGEPIDIYHYEDIEWTQDAEWTIKVKPIKKDSMYGINFYKGLE